MSTAPDALPGELVERFAAALERLNPQGGKIGLAVSGGPDSMAMMLLADAAIPGGFEVATVDHGLRTEAKDECALVAAACEKRRIPCRVLTVEIGEGNLQSMARQARYEALARWGAEDRNLATIATAHHADDQAETLLMRLNRGSGVAGLAGVRETHLPAAGEVTIIRPLLTFRRAELAQLVASAAIEVAHDPSNQDDSFDRVRIRRALAEADWLDPLALSRSAGHLAEAEEAIAEFAELKWRQLAIRSAEEVRLRPAAPREVVRRLVHRAIAYLGSDPRGGDIARLVEKLERGGSGNVAGVLTSVQGEEWVFRPEPPRRTR